MVWWRRFIIPVHRIWLAVAKRIGFRRTGLIKLKREVRTCEYEDVHVLWEMLNKTETIDQFAASPKMMTKKRRFWNMCDWARPRYPSRGF